MLLKGDHEPPVSNTHAMGRAGRGGSNLGGPGEGSPKMHVRVALVEPD